MVAHIPKVPPCIRQVPGAWCIRRDLLLGAFKSVCKCCPTGMQVLWTGGHELRPLRKRESSPERKRATLKATSHTPGTQ